jgi:hypothetical protein
MTDWESLVFRDEPIKRAAKGPATATTHDQTVELVRANAPVPEPFVWVCTKCNHETDGTVVARQYVDGGMDLWCLACHQHVVATVKPGTPDFPRLIENAQSEMVLLPKGVHMVMTEIKKKATSSALPKKMLKRTYVRITADDKGSRFHRQYDGYSELRSNMLDDDTHRNFYWNNKHDKVKTENQYDYDAIKGMVAAPRKRKKGGDDKKKAAKKPKMRTGYGWAVVRRTFDGDTFDVGFGTIRTGIDSGPWVQDYYDVADSSVYDDANELDEGLLQYLCPSDL